jgi:hypothetical protein
MIKPFMDKLGKEVAVVIGPTSAKLILKETPEGYTSARYTEVVGRTEDFDKAPSITLVERVNKDFDVHTFGFAHGVFGDLAVNEMARLVREF